MGAELRTLDSPDSPGGITTYAPADERSFSLLVEASIGAAGSPGADLFGFQVVGSDRFSENRPEKEFRWGRHYLVVDRWDPQVVRRAIDDLCKRVEGRDWQEIAVKLASYGHWEFES
jgi:hypothetical protein